MALQDHARLPVFFNAQYLTEVIDIRIRSASGEQKVLTLEGLVGFSPGPGETTITLKCAIPIGGTEAPFQQLCMTHAYCTMQIGVGAVSYQGTGKIIDCDIGQSVNSAAEFSLSWEGEPSAME
jgi:hypothetical protein